MPVPVLVKASAPVTAPAKVPVALPLPTVRVWRGAGVGHFGIGGESAGESVDVEVVAVHVEGGGEIAADIGGGSPDDVAFAGAEGKSDVGADFEGAHEKGGVAGVGEAGGGGERPWWRLRSLVRKVLAGGGIADGGGEEVEAVVESPPRLRVRSPAPVMARAPVLEKVRPPLV